MSKKLISRRRFLARATGVTVAGAALLAGCGEDAPAINCTDTTGLSPEDVATRTNQHYAESSPYGSAKQCTNCNFYTGNDQACGTCTLVRGHINPYGYCDSWIAKA